MMRAPRPLNEAAGEMSKGKVWVDTKGMTLYTFDKDTKTKSKCNGKCAVEWPPLAASAGDRASGKWTIIKRDDRFGKNFSDA